MSSIQVGSNKKFAEGWEKAFGGKSKRAKSTAKKATAKKGTKKKAAKGKKK